MTPREPRQTLEDLGAELRAGWAREERGKRRSPFIARPRHALLLALAGLALVPGAVATRDAIFAGDPPPFPEALRTPGAALPGAAVYVARGDGWALSASSCGASVSVFLEVPGGGAGGRCDIASARARRVHTYYDPGADRTWVFGTAPREAASVRAARTAAAVRPVTGEPLRKGRLPAGLRVFVASAEGVVEPGPVRVLDAAGRTLETCVEGRCAP